LGRLGEMRRREQGRIEGRIGLGEGKRRVEEEILVLVVCGTEEDGLS